MSDDAPVVVAADWSHHDMLAQGWVVLDNGYAVSTLHLGQKPYTGPAAASFLQHPTTRYHQELGRGWAAARLPWWRVSVMARDMVSRNVAGLFATEADAREIADLIRRSSDAWDSGS